MTKLESLIADFEKAAARLEEVLAVEKTDITRDSAIQRFEMAFELCWKTAKAFVEEHHNAACTSPRTCFREAFRHGLIEHEPFWIDVTKLRNYTVHTYNEQFAEYVYGELPEAAKQFRVLLDAMRAEAKN